MVLEANVGERDRLLRAAVGVTFLVVAVDLFLADGRALALVAALAGAGLLFNAATRFCGAYALLGIDTCSRK